MDPFLEKFVLTGTQLAKKVKKASKLLAKSVRDISFLARSLSKKERFRLSIIEQYIDEKEKNKLIHLIKQQKAEIKLVKKGWSFLISGKDLLPRLSFVKPEKRKLNPDLEVENKIRFWLENLDKKIKKKFYEKAFREFAGKAWIALPQYIAPNIIGPIHIKQALTLQLFSKEPLHFLLLAQNAEERKKYFKSIIELAPICATASQNFLIRNLAKAHNGFFLIEDLTNLEKKEKIYDAMELGFISFVKPTKTYRFDTNIRVIAGAQSIEPLKSELNYFHLILEHQHKDDDFTTLAQKLIVDDKIAIRTSDIFFLRKYIKFASKLDAEIPPELTEKIISFTTLLKEKEPVLKYCVTPKLILTISRLAKASARLELRSVVDAKDIERAFSIVQKSFGLELS
ncbi:MAG: hypothetical protein ACP5JY_03050 [Candidatus Nanoarchaeia archaeon]